MSVTSGGTYDPWKLWSLLRASRLHLILMAALALFAAISTSLFVNVIAYEAVPVNRYFGQGKHDSFTRLASTEQGLNFVKQWGVDTGDDIGDWSRADATVVVDTTSTFNEISYGTLLTKPGQGWSDVPGQYTVVDAIDSDLLSLPASVVEVWDIPASRLGVRCTPANMSTLNFMEQGSDITALSAYVQLPGRKNISGMATYIYRGNMQIASGGKDPCYAVLWSTEYSTGIETSFVLVTFSVNLATGPRSVDPTVLPSIPSAFGDLQPRMQDYNQVAFSTSFLPNNPPYNLTVTWYGIACDLQRSYGFVNVTRLSGSNPGWFPSPSSSGQFTGPEANTPSLLYAMTKAGFPYQSPTGWVNGIGTALGSFAAHQSQRSPGTHLNLSTNAPDMVAYAHAFVYASGAVETSLLNSHLARSNSSAPAASYGITGVEIVLKYRMTYVPGIFLFGLLTLTLCTAIVLGMTMASWSSVAYQSMRVVDGPRFVADFAEAVKADEGLEYAVIGSRKALEKWTDGIRLRYVASAPDAGREGDAKYIRLVQTGLK